MNRAMAIHYHFDSAPNGIRGFSEKAYAERRVLRAGGDLKDLHESGGCFIYWPPALGPFPREETLAQWENEYDSRPQLTEAEQLVERIQADPKAMAALKEALLK